MGIEKYTINVIDLTIDVNGNVDLYNIRTRLYPSSI